MVMTSASQAEGRGFKSRTPHFNNFVSKATVYSCLLSLLPFSISSFIFETSSG